MLVGLGLKILNNVKKNNKLVLWTLAIPQLVFMLCTFFYMDVLIFYKWGTDYSGERSRLAPSIINTMIQVYAGFGGTGSVFWSNQRKLEKALVIIAYSMIPIMLFGVPVGTYLRRKKQSKIVVEEGDHIEFNDLIDDKI